VGLGLAIVKHLAELHGGRVLADSRGTGGGATFTVSLPLATAECAESDVPDKPAASLAFPSPRLEGLKVLLMDSDPDGRALETLVLEDAGAEVTAVTTPEAAIEAAAKSAPQVVLAEVGEDDGLLLIKRLRELSGLSAQVPAAALLGFGSADERTRALLAGFQTCVPKPVDSGELVAVVATLANRATAPGRPTPAR
jgi:CheY-like chemotaxis protein